MRAVRYDRFGGIDHIQVADLPDPGALPGQVVVQVQACCLNPNALQALEGAPFSPGRDLAGTVTAIGEGVQNVAVGDEVLGWAESWEVHAELVAVPAAQLILKPAGLSWDVAGSLYTTPMAGLAGVNAVAPRPGELVVVSGVSGGVGFTAAQLARRAGATVIGLSSAGYAERLQHAGLIPVEYGDGQENRVREAARGQPVAAFIDAVGHGSIDLALALGVPVARINTATDFEAARAYGVTTLGTRDAGGASALRELANWAASGELELPIAASYPLDQVKEAYRRLAKRQDFGRIVLHPQA